MERQECLRLPLDEDKDSGPYQSKKRVSGVAAKHADSMSSKDLNSSHIRGDNFNFSKWSG